MSPLLGHILAQVVSLGVGDRTEGRYIDNAADKHYEAATYVRAGLNLSWKHSALNIGYAPSLVVTPLESSNRETLIFQTVGIAGIYHAQRTTVTLSENLGLGKVNFLSQGLGDPQGLAPPAKTPDAPGGTTNPGSGNTPPASGTPTPGMGTTAQNQTANRIRALNETVMFATSVTALDVTQAISPVFSVSGGVGYFVSGSVGSSPSANYPVIHGPRAQLSTSYRLNRNDSTSTTLTAQYGVVSTGNNTWIFVLTEGWTHRFDKKTEGRLGAGLSASRTSQPNGLVAWSIYPTFLSAITYATMIDRSRLTLSLTASSAPALDPIRATVDPRVGLGANVGWSLKRFYSGLGANTSLSLLKQQGQGSGALNSLAGNLTMGYQLADAISFDGGVRGFWQNYEGDAVVPLTWAAFVGITVTPL